MWKIAHDENITMCIDNSFEAELYSLQVVFWLHPNFPKTDFVKYHMAAHDILCHGKMSRKKLNPKRVWYRLC